MASERTSVQRAKRDDVLHCPHGTACGACALLDRGYAEGLDRKRAAVAQELARLPRLRAAALLPCMPSPRTAGYRNRAKMAVGISRHGGIRLGYFRPGTREIVDAPECRVLVPELLATTRRLREFLAASRDIPRELRHIDLRCGSDPRRQHLTLVFRAETQPKFPLERLMRACPSIAGVSVNLNPSAGPQVLRGEIRPLWGEREIWVDSAGLKLRVSPGSFCQVNLGVLPLIHQRMAAFLGQGKVLADLYAGVGTHGLALRSRFAQVVLVEGVRSSIADLKDTIRRHELRGMDVVPKAVERSLGGWVRSAPDAVILNPSRAGAHASVLAGIASTRAARIAYLSCDPGTLARDLDLLQGHGFTTRTVEPIDMMPQTAQVEALALLERAGQPLH